MHCIICVVLLASFLIDSPEHGVAYTDPFLKAMSVISVFLQMETFGHRLRDDYKILLYLALSF